MSELFYLIKHETRPLWWTGEGWGTRQAAERYAPIVVRSGSMTHEPYFPLSIGGRWVGPCDGSE